MARAPRLLALTSGAVTAVPKRSARGLLHFLTARYVMTTENVFGDRKPPRSQIVVNLWHGEPPTKVVARFFEGQNGYHSTYAPVCSTVGRAYRSAEFNISPLQVPIIGAPRNDRMLQTDGSAVRRELLGDDADSVVFCWLPSFRAGHWGDRLRVDVTDHHPGVPFAAEDVQRLDAWLFDHGARVVVKLHPHDVHSFTGDVKAIRVLTQDEHEQRGLTLYTLLPAFDALAMIFAFPDVADYRNGRGLNLEPYEHWVPGAYVATMAELLRAAEDVVEGRDPMSEERGRMRLRLHRYHDDQSTTDCWTVSGSAPCSAPIRERVRPCQLEAVPGRLLIQHTTSALLGSSHDG